MLICSLLTVVGQSIDYHILWSKSKRQKATAATLDKLSESAVRLHHRVYKTRLNHQRIPIGNVTSLQTITLGRPATHYLGFCFVEVELVLLYGSPSPAVFSAAGWYYPEMTGALLHMFNNILHIYRPMHRMEIPSKNRDSPLKCLQL